MGCTGTFRKGLYSFCAVFVFLFVTTWPQSGFSDQRADETSSSGTEIGYWVWSMGEPPYQNPPTAQLPDVLYIQTGEYHPASGRAENPSLRWPEKMPPAKRYIAVLRVHGTILPTRAVITNIIEEYYEVRRKASAAGKTVAGLQIDFDCPTDTLRSYAEFLEALRKALPMEYTLSITALLDWFTPGTDIRKVLQWVTEYIPQFYDTSALDNRKTDSGIALQIDTARWAPVFNSYRKPYRIGISAFGRISEIANSTGGIKERYYRHSSLSEILINRSFRLQRETTSKAGEKILLFTEPKMYQPGKEGLLKVVLPTRASIASAYEAALAMGGLFRGVVFFRWPSIEESMTLTPKEIFAAINNSPVNISELETKDGHCAAVSCIDLYLRTGERFLKQPRIFQIQVSSDIEYFIPSAHTECRQSGPRAIRVEIPAYAGNPLKYVGRVVTDKHAAFSLEGEQ